MHIHEKGNGAMAQQREQKMQIEKFLISFSPKIVMHTQFHMWNFNLYYFHLFRAIFDLPILFTEIISIIFYLNANLWFSFPLTLFGLNSFFGLSIFTELYVLEFIFLFHSLYAHMKKSEPSTEIIGAPDLYIESGSTINVSECNKTYETKWIFVCGLYIWIYLVSFSTYNHNRAAHVRDRRFTWTASIYILES